MHSSQVSNLEHNYLSYVTRPLNFPDNNDINVNVSGYQARQRNDAFQNYNFNLYRDDDNYLEAPRDFVLRKDLN